MLIGSQDSRRAANSAYFEWNDHSSGPVMVTALLPVGLAMAKVLRNVDLETASDRDLLPAKTETDQIGPDVRNLNRETIGLGYVILSP